MNVVGIRDVHDTPCDITFVAMQYDWNIKALFNPKFAIFKIYLTCVCIDVVFLSLIDFCSSIYKTFYIFDFRKIDCTK